VPSKQDGLSQIDGVEVAREEEAGLRRHSVQRRAANVIRTWA
jgi:hypothetical protein